MNITIAYILGGFSLLLFFLPLREKIEWRVAGAICMSAAIIIVSDSSIAKDVGLLNWALLGILTVFGYLSRMAQTRKVYWPRMLKRIKRGRDEPGSDQNEANS
jgi:hypothetical protein